MNYNMLHMLNQWHVKNRYAKDKATTAELKESSEIPDSMWSNVVKLEYGIMSVLKEKYDPRRLPFWNSNLQLYWYMIVAENTLKATIAYNKREIN